MANLIIDERDQKFVLYEMLGVDKLARKAPYTDFSPDVFDMILTEAQKFAVEEIFPTLVESDREGCKLEKGRSAFPRLSTDYTNSNSEGGWSAMGKSTENRWSGPSLLHNGSPPRSGSSITLAFWFCLSWLMGHRTLSRPYGSEAQKNKIPAKDDLRRVGRDHVPYRTKRRDRRRQTSAPRRFVKPDGTF